MKCKCGADAHYVYGDKCEDCYIKSLEVIAPGCIAGSSGSSGFRGLYDEGGYIGKPNPNVGRIKSE